MRPTIQLRLESDGTEMRLQKVSRPPGYKREFVDLPFPWERQRFLHDPPDEVPRCRCILDLERSPLIRPVTSPHNISSGSTLSPSSISPRRPGRGVNVARWKSAHLHQVQIQYWISHQLSRSMIRHLTTSLRNVEFSADILDLFLLWMERIGIGRVIPPSRSVRRGMFCPLAHRPAEMASCKLEIPSTQPIKPLSCCKEANGY